jgi:hypothetical protein
MFSAIRSGDYYMFEELDDDVLEEKDETSSDDEGGKHDGERRVTLSKVGSFLVEVLVENRERMACLSVAQEMCELIYSTGFQALPLHEPLPSRIIMCGPRIQNNVSLVVFIDFEYFCLSCSFIVISSRKSLNLIQFHLLYDVLHIIYFWEGKEVFTTVLLSITVKWKHTMKNEVLVNKYISPTNVFTFHVYRGSQFWII